MHFDLRRQICRFLILALLVSHSEPLYGKPPTFSQRCRSIAGLMVLTAGAAVGMWAFTRGDGSPGMRTTEIEKDVLDNKLADYKDPEQFEADLAIASGAIRRFLYMKDHWRAYGRGFPPKEEERVDQDSHPRLVIGKYLGYLAEERAVGRSVGLYPTDEELMNNKNLIDAFRKPTGRSHLRPPEVTPEHLLQFYVGGFYGPTGPLLDLPDDKLEKYIREILKRDIKTLKPNPDTTIEDLVQYNLIRLSSMPSGSKSIFLKHEVKDGGQIRREELQKWFQEQLLGQPVDDQKN